MDFHIFYSLMFCEQLPTGNSDPGVPARYTKKKRSSSSRLIGGENDTHRRYFGINEFEVFRLRSFREKSFAGADGEGMYRDLHPVYQMVFEQCLNENSAKPFPTFVSNR
jgi:hypothetical protein